jgi:predicted transcriptional regulator
MPDQQEERLTERLMVQLSERDLRALQAIADSMERPLAWVARRGIRLYISQVLAAEETLARGDEIIEEMRREARARREAGEEDARGSTGTTPP